LSFDLSNKKAVVTGASRGIGRGIALKLAECGCDVIVNYEKNDAGAKDVVDRIRKLGRESHAIQADVASEGEVSDFYDDALIAFKHIDILVNNAGIHQHLKHWELPKADWDRVLDVNLTGAFLCTKAFSPQMKKSNGGKIVNISSVIAYMGTDHEVHYAASKAGLVGLTKSLALELAPYKINVNAIAPGYIKTDMTAFNTEEEEYYYLSTIPMGLLGEPEDIANTAAFLCSKDSSYITGEVIHVNGGLYRF
jgi:3-oxoacyl-[acyl-carrier protein] reductase